MPSPFQLVRTRPLTAAHFAAAALVALLVGAVPALSQNGTSSQAEVFGLQAKGSSFVYVFDRSLSMKGLPLAAAKRELVASLHKLTSVQQFQIVFYNQEPRTMQPRQMVFADKNGLHKAESFVSSIVASGGTDHVKALRAAMSLSPDAIIFLTDADEPQLTEKELAEIHEKNGGIAIHVIEFKSAADHKTGPTLRTLAEENRGEYKLVEVKELPKNDE
jgi:hypothetical protein